MTAEKKVDPFKPQQPIIPGVSSSDAKAKPEPPASSPDPGAPQQGTPLPINLIAVAVGALIILVAVVFWSRSSNPKPALASADSTGSAPSEPAATIKSAPSLPTGPGPVATTEELAKPWSAKRFLFRNSITGQPQPALVVRLPRGEYWGFSLVEPFGSCELEFVTDLDKLKTDYGFRADHPMVGDPCNHTVYDLLRYGGGASSDDLVRGVIVQGSGIRPPMAIEIRANGKEIMAVREE
ncbi:MAG TPA: hypothetical protein VIH46_00305 [Candidatus Acidoferrales bacterium]